MTSRASAPAAMSLPHSSYDPRRVCLNPFPNVSLGKHRRTIGVYLSGALVRRPHRCNVTLTDRDVYVVRTRELDVP